MRGKATNGATHFFFGGITPAYAGKSLMKAARVFRLRDHPCVCGEKLIDLDPQTHLTGSPLRMRGKVRYRAGDHRRRGITPAYAGKREQPADHRACKGDHPCVCGEKDVLRGDLREVIGSPLRMRGKGSLLCVLLLVIGITPAYAGKSYHRQQLGRKVQDHPCVCGEKTLIPRGNQLS